MRSFGSLLVLPLLAIGHSFPDLSYHVEDNPGSTSDETSMDYFDKTYIAPMRSQPRDSNSYFISPYAWGPGTMGNRILPRFGLSKECFKRNSKPEDCQLKLGFPGR